MRRGDLRSAQTRERQTQKGPVGNGQRHPISVPVLEDKKLMAQGEDFCLQPSLRTERITKVAKKKPETGRSTRAYCHIALSAIGSTRTSFY